MSTAPEKPAIDEGDENPDDMAGDVVGAEHDLDVSTFSEEDEDD